MRIRHTKRTHSEEGKVTLSQLQEAWQGSSFLASPVYAGQEILRSPLNSHSTSSPWEASPGPGGHADP